MVNNKKELERQELHKAIWAIANKLRGAVDGWDFKMYVLGFIYYRFISEKFENYVNENQKSVGIKDFKYSEDSDENALKIKNAMIKRVGYFILPSELFSNVAKKAEKDENLNETLEKIFSNIEASAKGTKSENLFKGTFDDVDVNNPKKLGNSVADRNKRLADILEAIANMKLGNVNNHEIDAFGDAYE